MTSAESLLTQESLQAVVRGQLKTTIRAHGAITGQFIGSAARRIANDLLWYLRQVSLKDLSNAAAGQEEAVIHWFDTHLGDQKPKES